MAARAVFLATVIAVAYAHEQGDVDTRQQLKQQVISLGVVCEDMCKKVNAYPDCQCPGFGGMPASDDDTRSCMEKYCHPPVEPCPNDGFFTCVKESTSLLQASSLESVPVLLQQLTKAQQAVAKYAFQLQSHGASNSRQHKISL
eukprot:gnl/MRDRNA2_/MRDRNA2_136872_c0_seq1.p1 gnl/MRDRNA2_/MRDRNA2_136872_c0~~gnl/MRDRNA2_/MRDRNA2_136872_c0_seq1.p1  ORF type:complete len:144 (+),score=39.04 gnl/MRDRNA2_/MRDRNA2_136872_c0_seq1:74-505(+)